MPYRDLRLSAVRHDYIDDEVTNRPSSSRGRETPENLVRQGDIFFTRLCGSIVDVPNCAVVRDLGDALCWYPDRLIQGIRRELAPP